MAALLLKQQGYELIGVTMNLFCGNRASDKSCCSMEAALDAKKVCGQLDIPHYSLNFKDEFKKIVIDDFINEYRQGRTPNPCIRCNQFLKFDQLLKKANGLGAQLIATGHYCRIQPSLTPDCPKTVVQVSSSRANKPLSRSRDFRPAIYVGRPKGLHYLFKLLKARDPKKDQSYVLYRLGQDILPFTLFPLGEMTKQEVREIAKKNNLPVADKPESQDICFIEGSDYGAFIKENAPELVKPGNIVDTMGKIVGEHQGIAFYTIGQRKGIGAHQGEPKYVVKINVEKNEVVIGSDVQLCQKELIADDLKFVSGIVPDQPLKVAAKIRYNSMEAPAQVNIRSGIARVSFDEPQRAVTPGQAVVFYDGDEVVGGGIIKIK